MPMRQLLLAIILLLIIPTIVIAHEAIDDATNDYRESQGLSRLLYDDNLQALADHRAQEIAKVFAHVDLMPRLEGCWDWASENLAYNSDPIASDPTSFLDQWINSPVHNSNMLGNWTHMASGYYWSGTRWNAVQIFGRACQYDGILLPNTATDRGERGIGAWVIMATGLFIVLFAYINTASRLEKLEILCNNCDKCKAIEQDMSSKS